MDELFCASGSGEIVFAIIRDSAYQQCSIWAKKVLFLVFMFIILSELFGKYSSNLLESKSI